MSLNGVNQLLHGDRDADVEGGQMNSTQLFQSLSLADLSLISDYDREPDSLHKLRVVLYKIIVCLFNLQEVNLLHPTPKYFTLLSENVEFVRI